MLINCPKCGFSQPQDRYCANCGVDMTAFKLKGEPLSKKLMRNPFFLLAIVAAVAAGGFLYIRKHYLNDLSSFSQSVQSNQMAVLTETEGGSSDSQDGTIQNIDSSAQEDSAPSETATESQAAEPGSVSTTPALQSESNPNSSSQTSEYIKVKAIYAEVDIATLEKLKLEGLATGQFTDFGEFKAGAIPDIRKKLSSMAGITVLQTIEKSFTPAANTQQWFLGSNESEIGINTLLNLEIRDSQLQRGEVEILRSFKDELGAPPTRKTLPVTSFELPAGMGWMLTIPINRVAQFETESPSEGILKIFQSAAWKSKRTEFTLFLEFDTSKP